jgi:4-amino-4-deoxy-L-arabinose transferase-like glycosyltransferase
MAVLLPVLFALFSTLAFRAIVRGNEALRWRKALLATTLLFGALVATTTELMSLARALTPEGMLVVWLGCTIAALAAGLIGLRRAWPSPSAVSLGRFEWALLGSVAAIVVALGVIALAAAPHSWDSMTYHLARVAHWIQDRSVAHYPTNIPMQLRHNPWAEFALLHFQLLSGGDRFGNLIQWFSLLGSVTATTLIALELGADRRVQLLTATITATIPMAIAQSTTTYNDLTVALWLACLTYYLLRFEKRPVWYFALAAGVSLGLALLTKATAYVFAAPLLGWFGLRMLLKLRWAVIAPALLVALAALSLNLGHSVRNYQLYGHPLGMDENDSYTSRVRTPGAVLSSVIRNMALHVSMPSGFVNAGMTRIIQVLHVPLGIGSADPRTTLLATEFRVNYPTKTEDRTGNFLHLLLILGALLLFYRSAELRRDRGLVAYSAIMVVGFVLFCAYLRWQPFHSRLQLPLFVLWTPFLAIVLARTLRARALHAVAVILVLGASYWVAGNTARPLIGFGPESTVFNIPRLKQFFMRRPEYLASYVGAIRYVRGLNCTQVGLAMRWSDWEYPFWVLLDEPASGAVRIEHVDVRNRSAVLATRAPFREFKPCAVIAVSPERSADVSAAGVFAPAWSEGKVTVLVRQAGAAAPGSMQTAPVTAVLSDFGRQGRRERAASRVTESAAVRSTL